MTLPLEPNAPTAAANAPDVLDFGHAASTSRQPLPASRKVRVQGLQPGVSVPMREIALTNGEKVTVYDTSGPYTDPTALIDLRRGLETVRSRWIAARSDRESYVGRAPQPVACGQRARGGGARGARGPSGAARPRRGAAARGRRAPPGGASRITTLRREADGLQRT